MRIGFLALLSILVALASAAAAHGQKRIVLSYDDAPRSDGALYTGNERTTRLINALDAVDSGPVAFFVTTAGLTNNENGQARLEAYASVGHILANHTHSHMWAHQASAEEYLADVDRAQAHLAEFQNTRPWFRFPYLDEGRRPDHVTALANGLEARGLVNGYVTVDTYDWHLETQFQQALQDGLRVDYDALRDLYIRLSLEAAEFYDQIAMEALGHSPVHVLLLHENDLAALFSSDLIAAFRAAGWEIVHPDDAYTHPLPAPSTQLTSQGRVAALAIDAGREPSSPQHWGINAAAINRQIADQGVFQEP